MRCPSCKGMITERNFLPVKVCPACGEKLKGMFTKEENEEFRSLFTEFRRGRIFLGKVAIIIILLIFLVKWIIGL